MTAIAPGSRLTLDLTAALGALQAAAAEAAPAVAALAARAFLAALPANLARAPHDGGCALKQSAEVLGHQLRAALAVLAK